MAKLSDADTAFIAWCVRHNASRHLALHCKEPNGLLVWRAFQEYRAAGLPVPEELLVIFDRWATAVATAKNEGEVAKAIEAGTIGRKTALQRLRSHQLERDVLERFVLYRFDQKMPYGKAIKRLAGEIQWPEGRLKTMVSRWFNPQATESDRDDAGAELQAAWLRQSRE
jgi:hypothetical protein